MYLDGDIGADPGIGVALIRKAAANKNIKAQFQLASMYREGEFMEQDLAQAFRWIRKAAQQGDKNAQ